MPHMEFLRGVKGLVFGNSGKDDSTHTDADERSHAGPSEDMAGEADGRGVGSKRRAPPVNEQQPVKKLRTISRDEQQLLGGRAGPVPSDAQPLGPPTRQSVPEDISVLEARKAQRQSAQSQGQAQAQRTRAMKPGAGSSHWTGSTLGNTQPGKAGAQRRTGQPTFRALCKEETGAKSTKTATGSSLDNRHVGDAFSRRPEEPVSKRRKTHGASLRSTAKNTVVLIDDDDNDDLNFGDEGGTFSVEEVNGHSVVGHSPKAPDDIESQSQPHSHPRASQEYFKPTEMYSVNHSIDHRTRRRRRSPSHSSHHVNGSSNPQRPESGVTNHSADISDLATASKRPPSNAGLISRGERPQKTGLQPIDLVKGTEPDDIKAYKDTHHVASLNAKMTNMQNKRGGHYVQPTPTLDQKAARREQTVEQTVDTHLAAESHQTDDKPLRKQLRREGDLESPREKLSRRQMMQATSNEARNVDESPDHLAGSITVSSREQQNGWAVRSNPKSLSRESSPSDLKRTKFTSPSQRSNKGVSKSRKAAVPLHDETGEDVGSNKIPLKSIYSRGCILDTTSEEDEESRCIDLVWCEDRNDPVFEVHENGKPHRIFGKGEIMTIGKRECRTLHTGDGYPHVVLKGPASGDRSNGNILLMFLNQAGRDDFLNNLISTSPTTLATRPEKEGRIQNMFKNLMPIVEDDSTKCKNKVEAESKTGLHDNDDRSEGQRSRFFTSNQGNRYELTDGKDNHQTSLKSRMQPKSTRDVRPSQMSPHIIEAESPPTGTRKSTRQSKPAFVKEKPPTPPPAPERWTATHHLDPWPQSVMYPASGAKRVTVDFQDIERLDEGEFLNDNLVGYALRQIEENMAPEHKSKVHFFNSFFFTALTTKNGKRGFNYESVKKWTKQKDILNTPYVVVPINENLHWYVAIICNLPNLVRKTSGIGDDTSDVAAATPSNSQPASTMPSPIRDLEPVIPDSQDRNADDKPDAQAMRALSLDDPQRQNRAGSETFVLDENGHIVEQEPQQNDRSRQSSAKQSSKKSRKRGPPPPRKYPTNQPTIITLDSFGVPHSGQVSTLKDYIRYEARDKRGMEVSRDDFQGMKATGIPEQPNFCDCGLYLVGYVEEFAKDPEAFISKILNRELDRENDFASFDPSAKRAEIRNDLIKLQAVQEQERLAAKKAKKLEKNKVAVTAVNSPAQTAPAAVATTRVIPAQTQEPTMQTTEAHSPVKASPSKPSWTPSEKPERPLLCEPEATSTAREKSLVAAAESLHCASDGELETAVPRALAARGSTAAPARVQYAVPDQVIESAATDSNGEDPEMLDYADAGEAEAQHEAAQRPMRNITSPELDAFSKELSHGIQSPSRERSPQNAPA